VEALAKTVAGTSEGTGGWSEAAAGAAHVGPLGGLDHPAADPWGTPYVVSRRPLPGRADGRGPRYEIIVLSAGPDGTWSTPLREGATGPIGGDDIAHVLRTGG
jgi:hypothetical protein